MQSEKKVKIFGVLCRSGLFWGFFWSLQAHHRLQLNILQVFYRILKENNNVGKILARQIPRHCDILWNYAKKFRDFLGKKCTVGTGITRNFCKYHIAKWKIWPTVKIFNQTKLSKLFLHEVSCIISLRDMSNFDSCCLRQFWFHPFNLVRVGSPWPLVGTRRRRWNWCPRQLTLLQRGTS